MDDGPMSTPRRPEPRSRAAPITAMRRSGSTAAFTARKPIRATAPVGSALKPDGGSPDNPGGRPPRPNRPFAPEESHPTMIDLASIRNASFTLTPTGYNPEEVDRFLADLADQLAEGLGLAPATPPAPEPQYESPQTFEPVPAPVV